MQAKLPPGTLDRLWNDPANWRGHFFYVCPQDPRLIVPKRQKWRGWTINFARPYAGLFLFIFVTGTIAPILCILFLKQEILLIPAIAIILLVATIIGFYLSSPKRYEEKA